MYNRKWYTNMCTRIFNAVYTRVFFLSLRHRCRVVFVLFSSVVHMPQREGMMRFGSHITVKDDIWNSSKSYNAIYSDVKLSHSLSQSKADTERERQRPIATRSGKNTTFNLILFRFAYSSHNSSITFNYFSAKSKKHDRISALSACTWSFALERILRSFVLVIVFYRLFSAFAGFSVCVFFCGEFIICVKISMVS